jgi:hypothetical protein
MIDLSDGLAGDLRHLLERSQVGAELLARAIPISRAARRGPGSGVPPKPPLVAALTDGEDYELLFTAAARDAVPLADAWRKQFPKLRLSCIGKITAAPGLKLRDEHGVRALESIMVTFISHSPAETEALGEGWGRGVRPRLGHRPERRPGRGQNAIGQGPGPRLECGRARGLAHLRPGA